MATHAPITLEYQDKLAIITLRNERKLNALTRDQYNHLGQLLRQVAERKDIYITLLIGTGRYFSAGQEISSASSSSLSSSDNEDDTRRQLLQTFVAPNLDVTRSFYTHPKILITALNGPVIGLSAALIAFSDFIYATPETFLLTPFTSLGLVAEGGASQAFVQRLGIAKANEALIMSKRISAEELVRVGFVNKIFDVDPKKDGGFREAVIKEVEERLAGGHLNMDSLLKVKELIRKQERETLDRQNVAEVFAGLERLVAKVPQQEFARLARGEKRHKL
ncbi:MAG: hypothetical protein M1816_000231 [Peltula sp. TS41687]|nr:MAG: hypothetical protein M1816_000231 [Peltula sp. TS41687]